MKTLCATFLLAALLPLTASGHPSTIKCPRDGEAMGFDHQIGSRADAVCWYSHRMAAADGSGNIETHEAYIPCGD